MKRIDPGEMNEPVAVQAFVTTPDDAGGYTEAWTDIAEWSRVWAKIEALQGTEQIRALQTEASGGYRVTMWALEGMKSTQHRIRRLRDDAIMELVAPPVYDRDRLQMELLVHEVEVPA